jgi:hypothetical protein
LAAAQFEAFATTVVQVVQASFTELAASHHLVELQA